jgi:hypothetical protein
MGGRARLRARRRRLTAGGPWLSETICFHRGIPRRALKTELERWADERPSGLACRKLIARQRELCGRGSEGAERWEGMTLDDQRSVVDTVVDYFVVWPAARPRNSFSPERLTPVWRGS